MTVEFERLVVCNRVPEGMEELRWEGGRWVYGVQILACSVVLYSRSRVAPKSSPAIVDKARFPVSFTSFQRTFLLVFFLATGSRLSYHLG